MFCSLFFHCRCAYVEVILIDQFGWIRLRYGEREGAVEENREQDKPAGNLLETSGGFVEEGPRDLSSLRCTGSAHRLLHQRKALRVLF